MTTNAMNTINSTSSVAKQNSTPPTTVRFHEENSPQPQSQQLHQSIQPTLTSAPIRPPRPSFTLIHDPILIEQNQNLSSLTSQSEIIDRSKSSLSLPPPLLSQQTEGQKINSMKSKRESAKNNTNAINGVKSIQNDLRHISLNSESNPKFDEPNRRLSQNQISVTKPQPPPLPQLIYQR